jgi:hypothetical protein
LRPLRRELAALRALVLEPPIAPRIAAALDGSKVAFIAQTSDIPLSLFHVVIAQS